MKPYWIAGALALAVVGVVVFLKTTSGKAVGAQIGGAVSGFVGAVAGSAADTVIGIGQDVAAAANNPDINPLYGIGSAIGETIFDWTH